MSYILNKQLNAIYDDLEIVDERSIQNETDIAAETTRTTTADTANTTAINNEIARATAAEVANAQNINNQGGTITALQSQQNINTATIGGLFTQQQTNTNTIAQNTNDIAAEITRATAAEVANDGNISLLATNAFSAIATKQNIITSSTSLTTGPLTATSTTNDIDIRQNISAGNNVTLTQIGNITEIASSGTPLSTSQQYYFRAHGTGNQTVNSGNVLNFTQIAYDVPSGNYDTTNKRYVVPTTGTYQFFFQAFQTSSVATPFRLGIFKNNSVQALTGDAASNTERCGVILECVAGDIIQVKGTYGTGGVVLAFSFGWFEGYLLQSENNTITSTTDLTINSLTINTNLNSETFIRTIACAKILSGGANTKAINCSVNRTNVGRYTFTFTNPRPTADYVINITIAENSVILDDVLVQVVNGTQTATGFNYVVHEQDNSTNPGTYVDRPSFISIFDTD